MKHLSSFSLCATGVQMDAEKAVVGEVRRLTLAKAIMKSQLKETTGLGYVRARSD